MEGSGLGIPAVWGKKSGAVIQQSAGLTLVPKYIDIVSTITRLA
jgi:hypothetical protein